MCGACALSYAVLWPILLQRWGQTLHNECLGWRRNVSQPSIVEFEKNYRRTFKKERKKKRERKKKEKEKKKDRQDQAERAEASKGINSIDKSIWLVGWIYTHQIHSISAFCVQVLSAFAASTSTLLSVSIFVLDCLQFCCPISFQLKFTLFRLCNPFLICFLDYFIFYM